MLVSTVKMLGYTFISLIIEKNKNISYYFRANLHLKLILSLLFSMSPNYQVHKNVLKLIKFLLKEKKIQLFKDALIIMLQFDWTIDS